MSIKQKDWKEIVFLQVKIGIIREKGFLKSLEPERVQTLLALATFIDKDGRCYPSQSYLGYILGISESQANKRIKDLVNFRFEGNPILRKAKARGPNGKWLNNVYTLLPESGFTIFESSTANLSVAKTAKSKKVGVNTNYTHSLTTPIPLTKPTSKRVVLSKNQLETTRGEDGRGAPEHVKDIIRRGGIPIKS